MSWFSKGSLFLAVVCAAINAQTVVFHPSSQKAELQGILSTERSGQLSAMDLSLSVPLLEAQRNAEGFQTVSVAGLSPSGSAGLPEVWTTGKLIAVPKGFVPSLEVLDANVTHVENLVPTPTQNLFRCDCPEARRFHFNSAAYESNNFFPRKAVQLEYVGSLQGLNLYRIGFYPVRYQLKSRTAEVTHQMNVRVKLTQKSRALHTTVLSRAMRELVEASTLNGREVLDHYVRAAEKESALILVADQYKETIAPLVEWKKSRGLTVNVVTATQAGNSQEAIRKFIQKYYNDHALKPTYLIFVGNHTTMPTSKESTASGPADTDYTYALLTGDDAIPDTLYGRIVADSEAEVKIQMNRWMEYEKSPPTAEWYAKGSTIASNEGFNPSDVEYVEQIQEALLADTYKHFDKFYQGKGTATNTALTDAFNEGRSWVSYIGHGDGESWPSSNDGFSIKEVDALKNTNRLPFIVDVACMNGSWVQIPRCFGKAWVTHTDDNQSAGAVAFYGGSVNISWHPPAIMSVGVAKRHVEKKINTLGGMVLAGQLYMIEKVGNTESAKDNLRWYNLFGDPSLAIHTKAQ